MQAYSEVLEEALKERKSPCCLGHASRCLRVPQGATGYKLGLWLSKVKAWGRVKGRARGN